MRFGSQHSNLKRGLCENHFESPLYMGFLNPIALNLYTPWEKFHTGRNWKRSVLDKTVAEMVIQTEKKREFGRYIGDHEINRRSVADVVAYRTAILNPFEKLSKCVFVCIRADTYIHRDTLETCSFTGFFSLKLGWV